MSSDDALQTARDLTTALGQVDGRLRKLTTYGRLNRAIAVLAALLAICVAFLSWQVHRNGATIDDVHSTLITSCRAGNQTRAAEVGLWDHIASLSDIAAQPPAVRRKDDELLAYIRSTFAPRDCAREYRLP
jgi:hypothetical protein